MTVSPDAPPLAFKDLEDAVKSLRDSGLRLSTPRRLVLEALFAAEGPVSAAHLARKLRVDESSIYRNLEVLEQHGLIRHMHLGHSPGLYVLVGDEEAEYLYCDRCAKVTAVSPDRLDQVRELIKAQFGHAAKFTHFAIVGVCDDCAGPAAGTRPDRQHLHSHGDHVHAHPHADGDADRHEH
jgi:Fur family transcriptional regulator, ferric uptake regulator